MAKPSSISWSVGADSAFTKSAIEARSPGTVTDRPTEAAGRARTSCCSRLRSPQPTARPGCRSGRRGAGGEPARRAISWAVPVYPSPEDVGRGLDQAVTGVGVRAGRSSCGRPTGGDRRRAATSPSVLLIRRDDGTTADPATGPRRPEIDGWSPDRRRSTSGSARAAGGGTIRRQLVDRLTDRQILGAWGFPPRSSPPRPCGRHDGHRRDPAGKCPAPSRRDGAPPRS